MLMMLPLHVTLIAPLYADYYAAIAALDAERDTLMPLRADRYAARHATLMPDADAAFDVTRVSGMLLMFRCLIAAFFSMLSML